MTARQVNKRADNRSNSDSSACCPSDLKLYIPSESVVKSVKSDSAAEGLSVPVPNSAVQDGDQMQGVNCPEPVELTSVVPVLEESLKTELQQESQLLESAHPREILKWTADRFGAGFVFATAFGAEGMLLIHYLAQVAPQTPLFNLDTGYQFEETLEMVSKIKLRYGLDVEMVRPDLSVEQYETLHKGPVYRTDSNQCCKDRKLIPLRKRLHGATAWASAIRRDQSPDRAGVPIVGWDAKFGLAKVSPLANWSKAKVWQTIVAENVPYNELHDKGYPSVGCKPCTRCVLSGEDDRAGRWSGSKKTECGLHSFGSG